MFDEMVVVKLCSAVFPQLIQNNAGKLVSTGIYNRKTLGKVTVIKIVCIAKSFHFQLVRKHRITWQSSFTDL